jgi:hypothetical protein
LLTIEKKEKNKVMKQLKGIMVLWVGLYFMAPVLCAGTRPTPEPGVDLAKIQKQEEERRKKVPKSKYNFTNEDLKKAKSSKERLNITEVTLKKDESAEQNQENTEKNETAAQAVTAENQDTQGADGQNSLAAAMKTETYWKEEKKRIQTQIKNLETLIKQEEDKLGQLKNRYYVEGIDMLSEQLRVEKEIQQSVRMVKEYKSSQEAFKQELEDLYEKARREGVPSGWLRD